MLKEFKIVVEDFDYRGKHYDEWEFSIIGDSNSIANLSDEDISDMVGRSIDKKVIVFEV